MASATDVYVTLCYTTDGQPDLTQVISHTDVPGASLKTGWNQVQIAPAFAAKGTRMAVVITSAANHQIGMAAGGSYLDGTFFYTMDGVYYLGDFTKEMMLQIYGANFEANQVAINLGALNLEGGIRNIDLTARQIVPSSCQLIFEVLPNGTSTWLPITPESPLVPFASAPVLCQFRARFVGSPSAMLALCDGLRVDAGVRGRTSLSSRRWKLWKARRLRSVSSSRSRTTTRRLTPAPSSCTSARLLRPIRRAATTTLVDASISQYTIEADFTVPSTETLAIVVLGTTNFGC